MSTRIILKKLKSRDVTLTEKYSANTIVQWINQMAVPKYFEIYHAAEWLSYPGTMVFIRYFKEYKIHLHLLFFKLQWSVCSLGIKSITFACELKETAKQCGSHPSHVGRLRSSTTWPVEDLVPAVAFIWMWQKTLIPSPANSTLHEIERNTPQTAEDKKWDRTKQTSLSLTAFHFAADLQKCKFWHNFRLLKSVTVFACVNLFNCWSSVCMQNITGGRSLHQRRPRGAVWPC